MTAPPGRLQAATPPPQQPSAPVRPHSRDWLRYLAATVFTLLVAVIALPDLLFGLDQRSPFTQLVAFRPWILIGVAGLLVLLLVVMVFERRVLPFVDGVALVLLVGSTMLVPRMVPDPVPAGGTSLTVLAFNTYEGRADPRQLAALIEQQRPDVVALSEAGVRFSDKLKPFIEPLGYHLDTSIGPRRRDVEGVTTAVSTRLGDVHARIGRETSAFPYIELSGGTLGDMRVTAFHSMAPVPGSVPDWHSDLALLKQWCEAPTPAIVAGDFNATLDHSVLRNAIAGCGDAGAQAGKGLVPTWGPTDRFRDVFGPQIDHVIANHEITAESFEVHDIAGSDHRAILTRLRVPA
jgi:endonuclease/exonuclease/phosphatase (EEP) superfamily protein YafD